LILRFSQERFQGYFSFGPTLFLNKAFLESELAYPVYYVGYAVDVFMIPATVNQSWTSIGGNLGGGFTIWVAPAFGLFFDARYYLAGKKTVDWMFQQDEYLGLFDNFYYTFDSTDVDFVNSDFNPVLLQINPSFILLSGGIKIRLF
jgi:hypothetical protein